MKARGETAQGGRSPWEACTFGQFVCKPQPAPKMKVYKKKKKKYLQMRKNWNRRMHENISPTVTAFLRVCNKVFVQLWSIKGIAPHPTENRAQVQGSVGASVLVTCTRRDSEQDPGGCSMPTGNLERTTRYEGGTCFSRSDLKI